MRVFLNEGEDDEPLNEAFLEDTEEVHVASALRTLALVFETINRMGGPGSNDLHCTKILIDPGDGFFGRIRIVEDERSSLRDETIFQEDGDDQDREGGGDHPHQDADRPSQEGDRQEP